MKLASLTRAALLVSAVALVPATTAGLAAVDGRSAPQFGRLFTVYQLVKAQYVEQVDDAKLIDGDDAGQVQQHPTERARDGRRHPAAGRSRPLLPMLNYFLKRLLGLIPTLLIVAGAVNGLILPLGFAVLLWVAWRRRDLLGGYEYPKWLALIGTVVWLLTIFLGYQSLSGIAALWA